MKELILILQVSVSLIFFANKLLVLVGKKSGWIVGAIAAVLALFYFYLLDLYVYTVLEFGLIVLMSYGYLVKTKNPRTEIFINYLIIITMIVLTYFAFSGQLTIFELISSAGLLLGTYYLTHQKPIIGWMFYFIGHACAVYIGKIKGQDFFADFQLASAIISLTGSWIVKKKENA